MARAAVARAARAAVARAAVARAARAAVVKIAALLHAHDSTQATRADDVSSS